MHYFNKNWTTEELDDLYDNYIYYINHKDEACKLFNCSWVTVRRKASKLGLTGYNINKSNININNELRDLINGSLLSDASICISHGTETGYFSQSSSEIGYLSFIKSKFDLFGLYSYMDDGRYYDIDTSLYPSIKNKCGYIRGTIYKFMTGYYKEFRELRNKWYKSEDGIKIVPKIDLTPECVLYEYLGDGSIVRDKRGNRKSYTISLATCGFNLDEVNYISDNLSESIGIKTHINNKKCIVITDIKSCKLFLNYIKDYDIPSCYSYKFPKELISNGS